MLRLRRKRVTQLKHISKIGTQLFQYLKKNPLDFLIKVGVGIGILFLVFAGIFDIALQYDIMDILSIGAFWMFLIVTCAYIAEVLISSEKKTFPNDTFSVSLIETENTQNLDVK